MSHIHAAEGGATLNPDVPASRPYRVRVARAGARIHLGAPGTEERRTGEGDTADCRGTLRALYAQVGTPSRWVKAGTICMACGAWWPEEGYPGRQCSA